MSLVIWTSASADTLRYVVGPVVSSVNVEHRIVSDMGKFPECEAGDVVLACGTKALTVLQSLGVLPKNRTVGSLREAPFQVSHATVFVTYDPGVCSRDYARLPEVQWDVRLAARLVSTGSVKPVIGDYAYVESLHDVIEYVEEKFAKTGKAVDLACDLETKSLNPYNPEAWIICASFTVEEGVSKVLYFEKGEAPVMPAPWKSFEDMDYWEALWAQINWLLTSPKVSTRGANFKYDSNWIVLKWGIHCTNQKFDTLLVGSLLDENRSNSLKLHAKIYTPLGGYEDDMDKYDFSCLEKVPRDEMLAYVGGDTDATYRVAVKMKQDLLVDKALTNFYVRILQPSAKVFEKLERNGVCVDLGVYEKLRSDLQEEIFRLRTSLVECMPHKLRIKHKDSIASSFEDDKSPLTPKILKEFLFTPAGLNLKPKMFTEKSGEPATSGDHLMMFADNPDAANFISLFKELGSAQKTHSTYVVGFLKHLREDGRFHATYMLHRGDYGGSGSDSGTDTGRTSAKDPAVQTLTKRGKWAKRLREAYIAPHGKVILNVDFSQGELRIAAVLAEEPTMIQAYLDGKDLHSITAASLNGYELDEFMALPDDIREDLRSGGKAGNFGLIYGMQHLGFKDYAYFSYGVKMTEEEAFQKREAFFTLYDRLPVWHDTYKGMAHRMGFVRSPLGRVRHLPLIKSKDREMRSKSERQAVNSPVQSCLSDMMQLAMVLIDRQYGHEDIQMFMMTHDSLSLYVPEADAVEWAKRIKGVMESLPLKSWFGWDVPLTFVADAEVGPSLATLKKLKSL